MVGFNSQHQATMIDQETRIIFTRRASIFYLLANNLLSICSPKPIGQITELYITSSLKFLSAIGYNQISAVSHLLHPCFLHLMNPHIVVVGFTWNTGYFEKQGYHKASPVLFPAKKFWYSSHIIDREICYVDMKLAPELRNRYIRLQYGSP